MATQPPPGLPLFYKNLQPISSALHGRFRSRAADKAPFLAQTHAVPITVDEFFVVQRFYPIVFSAGEQPVPLALFSLNEGTNTFFDDEGKLIGPAYVPAYIRRYPWMLARLSEDAQELSLCFDPSTDLVGDFEEGDALFQDGQASEALNGILKFCEEFEMAAQRTAAFVKEIQEAGLFMEGEASIQPQGAPQPMVYRGFQMIDENKIRDLPGDKLRKMNQNGMLPLIFAHLISLPLVSDVFQRQVDQGKMPPMPGFNEQMAPAEA